MLFVFTVYTSLTDLMVNVFHWFSFSGSHGAVRPASIADFYLWHLATAVPLLNLTDTFHWNPPLTYTSFLVGILVVAFMLNVAGAFIAIPAEWLEIPQRTSKAGAEQAESELTSH